MTFKAHIFFFIFNKIKRSRCSSATHQRDKQIDSQKTDETRLKETCESVQYKIVKSCLQFFYLNHNLFHIDLTKPLPTYS